MNLQQNSFDIEGVFGPFTPELKLAEPRPGLYELTLVLASPIPAIPPDCTIRWSVPATGMHGYWTPRTRIDRVNGFHATIDSQVASQAPVLCYYDHGDLNRLTIACADALNLVRLRCVIIEETAQLDCSVRLFSQPTAAVTTCRTQLRIDARPRPYHQAISGVVEWWARKDDCSPMPVPDAARAPLYSTWYGFHQNLHVDDIIAECRIARDLGCKAVIIDDGWQTLDAQRGYAYTGDWKPERIADMRGFVDQIHALEMKFLLWYSLPFVGKYAKVHPRFAGMTLFEWESQGTAILDPRYPEVREYLIGIFETALEEWDLDGFKIDFIDEFRSRDDTVHEATDGRDHASVNLAVYRLMKDLMDRLRARKPEILIEFRQNYIGPLMRTFGNMFRAADCPYEGAVNRNRTIDLRLLSGHTAVHSDMLMWHAKDSVEHAALQILNVLFSVPQLSVRFEQIPPSHREMIGFWIRYWIENRSILIDGKLEPLQPALTYPLVRAVGPDKDIVALYADMPVVVGRAATDIVNAKASQEIVIRFLDESPVRTATAYDATGRKTATILVEPAITSAVLKVPPSGLLQLTR